MLKNPDLVLQFLDVLLVLFVFFELLPLLAIGLVQLLILLLHNPLKYLEEILLLF